MVVIQSHTNPDKSLKQHVLEVEVAAQSILSTHSSTVRKLIEDEIKLAVFFHDLGKAMPAFQKYIADPKKYNKKNGLKNHTPVSFLFWLLFARENRISKEKTLLIAVAVWMHHGDFPTFQSFLDGMTRYDYEKDYDISKYPLSTVTKELNLELIIAPDAVDFDVEDLFDDDFISQLSFEKAAVLKVRAILLFSVLLESDRTFLALSGVFLDKHLNPAPPIQIDPEIVDNFLIEKSSQGNQNLKLNQYRTDLRRKIIQNSSQGAAIESVTLPTGLGKTMVAAQWALKNRHGGSTRQKVIVVLPFLSIIDQTLKDYKNLFGHLDVESMLLESHSIANRKYAEDSYDDQNNKFNDSIDFMSETWNFDFIFTTFDQLLYSLLSSKKNNIMRFHNMADALIIIDEIQALPPILWKPLSLALNTIAEIMNTKILIMSATQPEFLETSELVPHPGDIFKNQNRYQLLLNQKVGISLDDFITMCKRRIESENWHQKRILLVFNSQSLCQGGS